MDTEKTNLQQPPESQNFIDRFGFILIILIIAIAIAIRLSINFSTKLMPGLMAAYNPLQVRSLLEHGKLGFSDLPFVFYFEAFFAKIFQFLGFCDLSGCVMFSSKIVDSFLYPLIAIPAFLLTKSIASQIKAPKWVLFIPPLLLTVSFPAFVMMADFQKNSIGLMWSLFFIYFLYKAAEIGRAKNYILAGIFFILTGLTHLGCLGFIIAFTLSFFFFSFIFQRDKRINLLKALGLISLAGGLVSLSLFFFDAERLKRLVSIFLLPLKAFENPTIFGILAGRIPLQPPYLINIFIAHLLIISGIIIFFTKRKKMSPVEKTLLASSVTVTIFMASLFLEPELGNRLYMMVYVPFVIILIPVLKYLSGNWKRLLLTTLLLILMVATAPIAIKVRSAKCITDEAYQDLFKLKSAISNPEKSLIITRHGLEFWAGWVLNVDASNSPGLKGDAVKKYDVIYYLRQESGQGDFGPFGPSGPSFPEVVIPKNAKIVYQDEFYILAEVPKDSLGNPYGKKEGPEKPEGPKIPEGSPGPEEPEKR